MRSPSLHHNLAGHFRMNRAEVREGSRLVEGVSKLFVRIHYFGLKDAIGADRRMRDVVSIRPGYGGTYRHC